MFAIGKIMFTYANISKQAKNQFSLDQGGGGVAMDERLSKGMWNDMYDAN